MSKKSVGGIALAISMMSSSTYNTFSKPLTSALSPLSLLFISELLTGFFVLFSFGTVPTIKKLTRIKRKHWIPLLCVGCLSSVLGPMLWFIGLSMTTVVNASLVEKVDIIIMLILARLFLGEKMRKGHFLAVGCVFFGLVFIALQGFTHAFTFRLADLIIMLSVCSYALGSIIFRTFLHGVDPHVTLFARSCIAVTAFFLISPFVMTPFIDEVRNFPVYLIPTLLGFGFIAKFVNVFCYYQAVERLPIVSVSIVGTLTTVGSLFFASLYLGETIAWYHIVGCIAIVGGNLMLELVGTHTTHAHKKAHVYHRMGHKI